MYIKIERSLHIVIDDIGQDVMIEDSLTGCWLINN